MHNERLSIILPCRNESLSIAPVVENLLKTKATLLDKKLIRSLEIIVVDDHSTDSSNAELKKYADKIQVVENYERLGYGASIKKGMLIARGELIAFMDMDSTYDGECLQSMLKELRDQKIEMICGDRLGQLSKMPIVRRVGNKLFIELISLLFGKRLMDSCTGMRIFKAEHKSLILESCPNQLNFALGISLNFLLFKIPFSETPIRYHRRRGRSKLNIISDGIRFVSTILYTKFVIAKNAVPQLKTQKSQ